MLRVVAPSTAAEPVRQRQLERARAAMLGGEPAKAAEILKTLLAADPDFVPALMLHAALSMQGGNRAAARVLIDRALLVSAKTRGEPMMELHALSAELDKASASTSAQASPPVWTQAPQTAYGAVKP